MLLLATGLATACATTPSDSGDDPSGGGKADGATPTVKFAADWSESVQGTLLAGTSFKVSYALDRLETCRGYTNGSEAWGVGGFAQYDGGTPVAFALSRIVDKEVVPVAAELDIPAGATKVSLWFEQTDVFGCHAYDSNDSANYTFDIKRNEGGAVLAFEADYTDSQSGPVRVGDNVVVHYEPERLEECAGSTGGRAAWSITGHWRVDGGAVHSIMVTRAEGSTLVAADPRIAIPRGSDLELWFDATNVWGCHAYDSALGANYHIAIQP